MEVPGWGTAGSYLMSEARLIPVQGLRKGRKLQHPQSREDEDVMTTIENPVTQWPWELAPELKFQWRPTEGLSIFVTPTGSEDVCENHEENGRRGEGWACSGRLGFKGGVCLPREVRAHSPPLLVGPQSLPAGLPSLSLLLGHGTDMGILWPWEAQDTLTTLSFIAGPPYTFLTRRRAGPRHASPPESWTQARFASGEGAVN